MHHSALREGTRLQARHKGQTYECKVVNGDGYTVELTGVVHNSLSAAGKAVTGHATNGWKFWQVVEGGPVTGAFMGPDEYANVPKPSRKRRSRNGDTPTRVEVDYKHIEVDSLPPEYHVHDGYVPMTPDDKGGYPVANPKLVGDAPSWFTDDSNLWIGQCSCCLLLVVNNLHVKGTSFDDYACEQPHHCTRRWPGETVEQAQDRLYCAYATVEEQKRRTAEREAREEARRNVAPLYESKLTRVRVAVAAPDEGDEEDQPLEEEEE